MNAYNLKKTILAMGRIRRLKKIHPPTISRLPMDLNVIGESGLALTVTEPNLHLQLLNQTV
jgi:hypothetical protein